MLLMMNGCLTMNSKSSNEGRQPFLILPPGADGRYGRWLGRPASSDRSTSSNQQTSPQSPTPGVENGRSC